MNGLIHASLRNPIAVTVMTLAVEASPSATAAVLSPLIRYSSRTRDRRKTS